MPPYLPVRTSGLRLGQVALLALPRDVMDANKARLQDSHALCIFKCQVLHAQGGANGTPYQWSACLPVPGC